MNTLGATSKKISCLEPTSSLIWNQVDKWMIDSHPNHETYPTTLWVFSVKLNSFATAQKKIQTSCDARTGMNLIQVLFQQVTQFTTNMGYIRTYPIIAQVMPTSPLVYSKLTFFCILGQHIGCINNQVTK